MTITRVADGRILEVNRADERVLGYAYGETIGRSTLDTGAWASEADRRHFVELLARDGRVLGYETRMRNKAGESIDARVFAERIEINGEACILAAVLNISDEKRHEAEIRALNQGLEQRVRERTAELQQSKEELESFAYAVSHDLRAPLRAVDGFLHILAADLEDGLDAKRAELLGRVRSACSRMNDLIEDLLSLSRVSRQPLARHAVDLSAIAREVAAGISAAHPGRSVEWIIAPSLSAECDPALARVVLENLLGNAWKYTSKTSPARIRFCAAGAPGEYMVADNGAGFDMRYAGRLFKPFQRLHGNAEFEGNGIGLSTVHRVLARHGGWIRAEAEPDRGATFRFTFDGTRPAVPA